MILLDVLKGKEKQRIPIWLMRQAGRYLPEYRALRKSFPTFLDLVLEPEAAAEVTLQPIKRFGFDAAILFADILIVPYALGQSVVFDNGIHMGPLPDVLAFDKDSFLERLSPVLSTARRVTNTLAGEKPLIGFAGGPFTVLCYMLEGQSMKGFPRARQFAFTQEKKFQQLMDVIVEATLHYLLAQIEAGVSVIQLFESWAELVPWQKQDVWVVRPLRRLIEGIREVYPNFPIISFLRGSSSLLPTYVKESGTTAVSLDSTYDLAQAQSLPCILQGNLDPGILLAGGNCLDDAIEHILRNCPRGRFIFNLGHGILPETPFAHVERLMMLVKRLA